jgi:hypothetical protein
MVRRVSATPPTGWEESSRSWWRASGVLSLIETLVSMVVFALVILGGASTRGSVYAGAAAIVVLEVAGWTLARTARERLPLPDPDELYAAAPLPAAQRRLVTFNLALTLAVPVLLATLVSTHFDRAVAIALLEVAAMPSALALYRVRRRNSWLGISRLQPRPRSAGQRE